MTAKNDLLLDIRHLYTSFMSEQEEVKAVDGVSLSIPRGKTVGLVGESGSGKSVTSLSILQLIKEPGKIKAGEIYFKGKDLLQYSEDEMRQIRGKEISMIFQEPMTSLNPTLTIGRQLSEVYQIHEKLRKKEAQQKSIEMLRLVGISSPEKRMKQYPYELSGGMRQRVMIAMALACHPDLLIADEPTTALDVTIQAQILDLIKDLQAQLHMSVLLITHDLGIVYESCDYVAVMYAGKIVEYADVHTLFNHPKHPYTIGLLNSLPRHDIDIDGDLPVIEGTVPSPSDMPKGCRFAPRCSFASPICQTLPPLVELDPTHSARCWIHKEEWDGSEVNVDDYYKKRTT